MEPLENKAYKNFESISPEPQTSYGDEILPSMIPTLLETSVLAIVIVYLVNFIIKPLIVDDRTRWFSALEKLTNSIDNLANKFDELETRIARLEERLK
jgi:hypothetical protein